jgi:hypothetical protein
MRLRLELPQRLSATGMLGLLALSVTHWLRQNAPPPGPVPAFVLGVMPNLAAAFAMPLIIASLTPRASGAPITRASRIAATRVLAFTTVGLVAWEFIQLSGERLVFDTYDLLATGLGSLLAYCAFDWHARRFEATAHEAAPRGGA